MNTFENLVKNPSISSTRVGDETVLLDLKSGVYFGLDAVSSRLWAALLEGLSRSEMADLLEKEFQVDAPSALIDIDMFVQELVASAILVRVSDDP